MAQQSYRVNTGFDFRDTTRFEAGDITSDLDRTTAKDLLAINAIEEVENNEGDA